MKLQGMAMDDKENATRSKVVKSEQKPLLCSFNALLNIGNVGAGFLEDEVGGTPKAIEPYIGYKVNCQHDQQHPTYGKNSDDGLGASAAACAMYDDGDEAAAVAVNFNSNRTSRNNSTENLSFSSDNFYPEDLLFFQDDDGNGAEGDDLSCESDDCVYAYRGDGAELYFPLEANRPTRIADNSLDDEMDFLEMDFEPDTLSEIDNGGNSVDSDVETAAVSDAMLMSGRHSSSHILAFLPVVATQQRQLFSSPIDDKPAAPAKALQVQTLLGKKFGRMSLHLDQIKGANECLENKAVDCEDVFERFDGDESVDADGNNINANRRPGQVDSVEFQTSTAHSLPNTLHTFGREHLNREQPTVTNQTSPSKVTGAKPKRLSTFSTSSSTSSKNSSKSRASLRSVIGPSLFNSSSFDERSVSCTEFRSAPPLPNVNANATSATSTNGLSNSLDLNDESCLDCLEKEFLANTIGKALEPSNCPKCRRKRFSLFRPEQQSRCRSGSPSFFSDTGHDSFYEMAHEYLSSSRKAWLESSHINGPYTDISSLSLLTKRLDRLDYCMPITTAAEEGLVYKAMKCDISGKQLLKNNISTDKEVVTLSTCDINEEILVRALEQLHVSYNLDLIKFYFAHHQNSATNLSSNIPNNSKVSKEFKDLKHFLTYESKKHCNHPKLKRLIEVVTNYQVEIEFKENQKKNESEQVYVSVTDILRQWSLNSNLMNLRDLDKRFKATNILGKIANIIRQTETKRTISVRPQQDSIAIPQYYPSGFLIVKKKIKP